MNLFANVRSIGVDPADLERDVNLTISRVQKHFESFNSTNTHAIVFMAAVDSSKEGRFNITAYTGGYSEVTWMMLYVTAMAQGDLPRWRKLVLKAAFLMPRLPVLFRLFKEWVMK